MKMSNRQKIGLFVILVLVVLFFALNFLRGSGFFSSSGKYYTYLSNVEGIIKTSPVYIKGLKVGIIEDIKLDPIKDSFLVKISVKREYLLPIDSKTEVYSSDILGGKAIRINVGNSSYHAKSGDTLKGENVPDLISLLASNVGPLKDKVENALDKFNITLESINSILDTTSQLRLKSSISNLNKTLFNLQQISSDIKEASPELKQILANLNSLSTSLADPQGDLVNVISNLNALSKKLSSLELNNMVEQINNLLQKVQNPSSTTGKLLTSDSLHKEIENLIVEINNLIKKIEQNPKKFLRISVF